MAKETCRSSDRKKQPKESLRILNTREKKEINHRIEEQWGCVLDKEHVWLMNNKGKLYLADKDIALIDLEKLRVDKIGLYIAHISDKGIRLSIEGSQMVGPIAKKNVIEIADEQLQSWISGKDIDSGSAEKEFVIIKHGNDFYGSGKCTGQVILNFVPKTRRISPARSSS